MNVGDRLREERERLGVSQERFALSGGVQKRAQIHYEKGERNPDSAYLAAIALMGVDVLYVLTGQRSQPVAAPALSKEEEALLDNYKHADDEGRRAAQQVLTALSKQRKKAA
ncbi:MAG: helix-turn-helix transcriptional regulator [Curvibacter lanceolatus]|uniref:helix-turn-helix domain-containing protein n=1 Tax=Curvibacter lanceolatus TaxID=86182 RepID=UPI0023536970|nr:helix-turn-helix transcriptional regulator [Curvibacter lanceolatus]MBV5296320.1 helix-turn-helix transcriptional regulator [Curvibacter lanceolatus]